MFLKIAALLFVLQFYLIHTLLPVLPVTVAPTTTSPIIYTNCTYNGYGTRWITLDNTTCYYFSNRTERMTWHDANQACQQKGAQLASIHDKRTNDLLSNTSRKLFQYYNNIYWIGLNALSQRGYYRWSDASVYQYASFPNSNAPSGVPKLKVVDDYYKQGRCIYYYALYLYVSTSRQYENYGYWYYDDCNDLQQFICGKSFATTLAPTTTRAPVGNCPQGWYQYDNQKCIRLVSNELTYSGAQKRCAQLNGELLGIHSLKEQHYITALIAGKPSLYIGLTRVDSTYRWSWADQSNLSYTNWGSQTTNYNYNTMCGVISTMDVQAGKWIPVECDTAHQSICEKKKETGVSSPPPKPFTNCTLFPGMNNFVQYRNSCYYFSDTMDTWDNAVAKCQQMSDAHLVSILNGFEYSFLMYYTLEYSPRDSYWIGFFANQALGNTNATKVFEWIDTWPNYYTRWADNEPAFNTTSAKVCVYQSKTNGTWKTGDCKQQRAYVCKKTTDKMIDIDYTAGTCPKNSSPDPIQSWVDLDKRSRYCYWFSMDMPNNLGQVTWADASFHCKQRNGSLASIHSEHDMSLLKNRLSKSKYNTWIGLYQMPEGHYAWDDRSVIDFTNWEVSDDDDDYSDSTYDLCVEIQSDDLRWHRTPCTGYTRYRYYVCQTPKSYYTTVTPTSSPLSIKPSDSSHELTGGAIAAIIIATALLIAVIGFGIIFAFRKYNIDVSTLSSFPNSLYTSSRREQQHSSPSEEPKVRFNKIDNNMTFNEK